MTHELNVTRYKFSAQFVKTTMRKVLVTGGNNFFSRAVVKVFGIGGDWSIYTLHNSSESKPVCENAVSVDLLDKEQLSKQLSVIKPDVVIHWYLTRVFCNLITKAYNQLEFL